MVNDVSCCRRPTSRPRCNAIPPSQPIIDSSNAWNQASAPIVARPPLHGPVQFAIHRGVGMSGTRFPQKLPLSLRGSSPPRNTPFSREKPTQTASQSVQPFSFLFCMGPECYAVQCIVNGDNKNGISSPCRMRVKPRPWGTCTKIGKDCTCGLGNIIADRHTDTHTDVLNTHHNTSQPRGRSN